MNSAALTTAPSRTLNRWWYVATGFLTLLFGTTVVNVLFNVLGKPMTAEFGWERSVISNGLSVETIMVGISIVALGILIDRHGPRIPSALMAAIFGTGLILMSVVPNNQAIFYLICILIGAGAGAVNPIAHSTVVSAWFSDRRGTALGILMAGLGACGVLMPYLANWMLDLLGWRGAFAVIGVLCTAIPVLVYTFVTRMPPEHDAERLTARANGRTAGESLLTLARQSRQFWLLSIAIFLVSSATFGLMSQVVPMSTDKGIEQGTAVTILSILSLSSLGARLLTGYLLDHFFAPFVASGIFVACGGGVYLLIAADSVVPLILGAILVGWGLGAEGDVAAYMTSRYFPKHSYGRVLGFVYFLYAMGSAFGIFLLGQLYSATGSYTAGIVPIIGMVVAAIALLLCMGAYRYTLDHESVEAAPGHSNPAAAATADR
ncbi:MFS transporter [Gordonia lacunae]|uniref:MFS transporter n=1 Tax=Gordonia lacunae TaxID=417102 RepID=A0A243QHK1_9ACTN|nr:MFS transporter [Gordonia lacunae]OUC80255.1 MFS transporter [Gordonia lacunae]